MIARLAMLITLLTGSIAFSIRPAEALDVRDIIFPVLGKTSYSNDFGAPRAGHTHQGNDILAPKHTPLLAAVDGRINYVTWPEASYGYFISLSGDDGYDYWYIHVNNDHLGTDDGQGGGNLAYGPGVDNGERVVKGQLIGWVGDSGNAESTSSHLHFEIHRPDDKTINPFYSLNAAIHYSKPVIPPLLPGEYLPFGEFRGGANLVLDELNDTNIGSELVVGAGPNGGPLVRVLNASYTQLAKFYAYDQKFFHGGVDVATGDINADGIKEIVTTPGRGSRSFVRVFTQQGLLLSEFLAYPSTFLGGAHVAVADLDGDHQDEIIVSPGSGMKPEVHVYRFTGELLFSWLAYTEKFKGGVDVAAVPFNSTTSQPGVIVTGALRGGGPEVRTFTQDGIIGVGFYAYDKAFRGGVRVTAHRLTDGTVNIFTVPYSDGGSELRQFDTSGQLLGADIVFERWWRGGYDVAADENTVLMVTGTSTRRTTLRTVDLASTLSEERPPRGDAPHGEFN